MKIGNLKSHTTFFDKARFKHPEFSNAIKGVKELIKCGGTIPVVTCLIGPSRVGKSVVIEQIYEKYGINPNLEEQAIVAIKIIAKSTPKMVVESLIEAMGVKPKDNLNRLRTQLIFLAKKKGVRLFIIDEIQHGMPQHQDSGKGTQLIADILKLISDDTNASILLVGLENTPEILQNAFKKRNSFDNSQEKQMIGRSFPPMHIPRIKLTQKKRLMNIMKGYQRLFDLLKQKFGITFPDVTDEVLALRLWIACRGYFGRLRFLFDFSIEAVDINGEVTLQILEKTYDKVMSEKAAENPFACEPSQLPRIARTVEHLEALDAEGK